MDIPTLTIRPLVKRVDIIAFFKDVLPGAGVTGYCEVMVKRSLYRNIRVCFGRLFGGAIVSEQDRFWCKIGGVSYLVVAFHGGHRDVVVLGHPVFVDVDDKLPETKVVRGTMKKIKGQRRVVITIPARARKPYECMAGVVIKAHLEDLIQTAALTIDEYDAIAELKANDWMIMPGQVYERRNTIDEGPPRRLFTFLCLPQIDAICVKYNLYSNE